MYDPTLVCTYNRLDGDEESQEALYRCQLIQALGLDRWDADAADRTIMALHGQLGADARLKPVYAALRANDKVSEFAKLFDADIQDDTLFRMLFSFDYFANAHRLVAGLLREEDVSTHISTLIACINI